MKKGEAKVWRIKGTVNGAAQMDDIEMPAVVNLIVDYRFPAEAVLREIETSQDQNPAWKSFALKELEKVKDVPVTIFKALPVQRLKIKKKTYGETVP